MEKGANCAHQLGSVQKKIAQSAALGLACFKQPCLIREYNTPRPPISAPQNTLQTACEAKIKNARSKDRALYFANLKLSN